MKLSIKIIAMFISCIFIFFACQRMPDLPPNNNEPPPDQTDDSDREGWVPFTKQEFPAGSQLRIKYFKGGYGSDWIEEMKKKFENDYPTVTVTLTPSNMESEFTSTIRTTLSGSPDDIYVCHNIPWETLSSSNLIMNLDGLYNSEIYKDTKNDTSIRYYDRIATSSLNSVRFNNSYYKVPQVQGAGGIAYNKTLFDANGWEVPTTYEELVELCDTINRAEVKDSNNEIVSPFVWTGTEAYLWDSLVYDWWVQIAGIDEFNQFMKYENKNMFNSDEFPALKKAWSYWYDLVAKNQYTYSHPQSLALDNLQCNMAFATGQAAMMPATCWIANEITQEILDEYNCEMGLIPSPFVKEAKKDGNGEFIRVAYDLAGKDSFIIAQRGKNKHVAQEFFKWMALEENARIFPENTNGLFLAIRYDFNAMIQNPPQGTLWEKDMINLLSEATRFNLYSSSPLVYSAAIPLSPYPSGNFYLEAFESYGSTNPRTPDNVFSAVWTQIDRDWNLMLEGVGLTP